MSVAFSSRAVEKETTLNPEVETNVASLDPNARILGLLTTIAKWTKALSLVLYATGFSSLLFGLLMYVGSVLQGVTQVSFTIALAVASGLIQAVCARASRGYSRALENYLDSGNQLKLVHLFERQRNLVIGLALVASALLGAFLLVFTTMFI